MMVKHVKFVQEYIDEYDNLLCRVELSEEQSISLFLAGLQNDVEVAVRIFKPRLLAELYGLAKLKKATLNAMKSKNMIPLLPNSRFSGSNSTYPNNPKPKDAIESMVQELLDYGVIRHTQSPFSSPIVMVKKNDGSWKMCVDYRQLNKHTIKDKFHVLLIEELIDELYGSKVAITKLEYPTKIQAMKEWHVPKNLKQLRGFLECLYNEAEQAFEQLKEAMMAAPILKLLNFEEDFVVETDASEEGTGVVLQQHGHLRGYLLDRHFKIKTYHLSLKYLLDQRISTPTQMKWLPKLMGFDYEIEYKRGKDNVVDDALSRIQGDAQLLHMMVSTVSSDVQQRIKDSCTGDVEIQALIAKLKVRKDCTKHYSWPNNLLTRKGKLVVGNESSLQHDLIEYFHVGTMGGHSGVKVRMKNKADKKRSEREFELNDWVYVKLQPGRKISMRKGRHHKLSPKFYGPYQVIARIGKVPYRLNLLANSHIHLVFHVSQLKAHKRDNPNTQKALTKVYEDAMISDKPQTVLERKKLKKWEEEVEYVLVQWVNGSREDATWESLSDMASSYPQFSWDS
uniref:Reverse transcriptase n=1 Tax=Tanacetum cinerariifolium TaxID=118510 RepID=A0A699HDW5_TANCI|nr:reverse transcriptase [Tanacetum cinerariifolium]